MEARQICIVQYQIATYSGKETVYCDSNDEDEDVIAKAKQQLRRKTGAFPMGYQSFEVTERENYFGE